MSVPAAKKPLNGPKDAPRREVHRPQPSGAGRRVKVIAGVVAGALALAGSVVALTLTRSGAGTAPEPAPTATGQQVAPSGAPSASGPATAKPLGRLEPVSWWDGRFGEYWRSERPKAIQLSRSADSWDHYSLSYSVDALAAAYQATGKRTYLDDAMTLVENVMATARPSTSLPGSDFKDGFRGWASAQENGGEVPLYESYFWRYATSLLVVIHQTPALDDDGTVKARYRRILAFAERNVAQKWIDRGARNTIYRSRTHMAAHWALITLNLSLLTSDPQRRAQYQAVYTAVDRGMPNNGGASLRGQLQPNPKDGQAYFWSDVWGSTSRPGQDTSHGSGVIAYVVGANRQGVEWTSADLTRFRALLGQVIWPRESLVTEFIDGSGTSNGWLADGWVKLGRYDPDLQRRLERHGVQNDQFMGNGALNAALLRCKPGATGPPACTQRTG